MKQAQSPQAVIASPLACKRTTGVTAMSTGWARDAGEVREAQRLRFAVFGVELGATLCSPLADHDVDPFDEFCEHLLVRSQDTGEVVGTYRLLTPAQARRAGGMYTDGEFDLSALRSLRPRMVELGRSCVHPDHRHGGVILSMWTALAGFMLRNGLETMVGCASIPLAHGGAAAVAGVWNRMRRAHLASPQWRVSPRRALPLPPESTLQSLDGEPPPLIGGYLRLGARVLGPPAWDSQFGTADLPMLMRMDDLHPRFRRQTPGG